MNTFPLPSNEKEKLCEALESIFQEGYQRKRRKIEDICPAASNFGDPTKWVENSRKVMPCCHLLNTSAPKYHGLHVSLIAEPFGKFIDTMRSNDFQRIELAIKMLGVASAVHKDEGQYKDNLLPIWNCLLQDISVTISSKQSDESDMRTAVTTINFGKHILGNIEFKKDLANCESNPTLQSIAYHVRLKKNVRGVSPMLSIIMVGFNLIQVYGAAWNFDDLCVDPLCQPISLMLIPNDPTETIRKLGNLLQAVYVSVSELKIFYAMEIQHPYFILRHSLKSVQKFMSKQMCFTAKYKGIDVFLKYSSTYGQVAHSLLADAGLAPRLIVCEHLAGGWYGVIMEYVQGTALPDTITDTTRASLYKAVKLLQDNNFVHGDLRPPNLMLTGETVCLLDFDWAGLEGEVRYPVNVDMSHSCWHKDVKPGGKILKAHDLHLVHSLY